MNCTFNSSYDFKKTYEDHVLCDTVTNATQVFIEQIQAEKRIGATRYGFSAGRSLPTIRTNAGRTGVCESLPGGLGDFESTYIRLL